MADKCLKGRQPIGETHHSAVLSDVQIAELRAEYRRPSKGDRYGNGKELQMKYGISQPYFSRLVRQERR